MSNNIDSPKVYANALAASDALAYGADDAGNAKYCATRLKDQYLYESKAWLQYSGTHWEKTPRAAAELHLAVIKALQERERAATTPTDNSYRNAAKPNRSRINAAVEILQSHLICDASEFDYQLDELNCANGMVDLRTGELHAHNPSQRFTYCLDVDYEPETDTQTWDDFLNQILNGQQDVIQFLQRAVGYSLTGHTREHKFFYLHGPTRAGKSTFTNVVARVLGNEPLAIPVGFGTFSPQNKSDSQNFDLAHVRRGRFVMASESDQSQRLDSPEFLRITGGDRVRCAEKNGHPFTYTPQFKLWFASNAVLKGDPTNNAFWARASVVEFPNSFVGREDVKLSERLRQPQSLRGILKWAVEGARQWHRNGLCPPQAVVDATDAARRQCAREHSHLAPIDQWITHHIREDGSGFVTNEDLFRSYEEFRTKKHYPTQSKTSLTSALLREGYAAGQQRKVNGDNHRGCAGIRLV